MRNQHRLTRCTTGWIPSKAAKETQAEVSLMDDVGGLTEEQLQHITESPSGERVTLNAQQLANAEKESWSVEWAVGKDSEEPDWTGLLQDEPAPPELILEEFKLALITFPAMTGLGWDKMHPRALLRLPEPVLRIVIGLLQRCEVEGRWPKAVKLVIIVLLPKADGGRRSIGLLPLLPRIWMRTRNSVVKNGSGGTRSTGCTLVKARGWTWRRGNKLHELNPPEPLTHTMAKSYWTLSRL